MAEGTLISVDAGALRQVLQALVNGGPQIAELQFTWNLPGATNPIDTLVEQYNAWAKAQNEKES